MEEDEDIPIIIGRLFLVTGEAKIDVKHRKLTFQVDNEKVTINMYESMGGPREDELCY